MFLDWENQYYWWFWEEGPEKGWHVRTSGYNLLYYLVTSLLPLPPAHCSLSHSPPQLTSGAWETPEAWDGRPLSQ